MARTCLTSDLDWYCAPDGSDATGDGSLSTPWQSPEYAYKVTQREFDLMGQHKVTVNILGKYDGINGRPKAGPWVCSGALVGAVDEGSFVMRGVDGVNAVMAGNDGTDIFQAFHDAKASFTNINLWPGAGGKAVNIGLSECLVYDVWTTTNGGSALFSVADGRMTTDGNIMLSSGGGGLFNVCVAEDRSVFYLGGFWTMNGAPNWTGYFANADIGGTIDFTGYSGYTGSHSGGKRLTTKSGIIHMNGLPASAIPGTGDVLLGFLE